MTHNGISRYSMEIATALLTAAIGVAICYGAWQVGIGWTPSGPDSGYFPFWIGVLVVAGSLVNLLRTVIGHRHKDETFLDAARLRSLARFTLPIIGFAVISLLLGLYVGTTLYVLFAMRLQGHYAWWRSLVSGIAISICFYLLFELVFQVPLLKGPLEHAFGIY
ncbi:tripartite tricarboxylate transporter TctB family protein [Salinicola sp. LHM]|uniref:tripartite tricarboxylate transporter TctB family protein n=1 Tax=Salinicola TaxID=404432 RepID=UPI0023E44C8A|nr:MULTISPECIES: tripartite tricarboxylate transporter TctB family protein [Salinicola]MDF3919305.1 tripartite tricarboxylate transporter TctB family protein [Salinicola salarius]WQH31863.1 tripartite tricarboxylate transporter TctB family protein [Salinicola sp. LHM]